MAWNRLKSYSSDLLLVIFCIALWSCEPEVERFGDPANAVLGFSKDTVFFDTVFTETRSITKRLKIYNRSPEAVLVDEITLNEGTSFSMFLFGEKGKSFADIQLLGKDSLLILLEAEIDAKNENLPFIIEDELKVIAGKNYSVPVIAWGQDAVFLKDTILECNYQMTADKPYVLYGAVVVDSLCTLSVDPGTKIYSHFDSGIFVRGSLKAQGEKNNRILFSNDRMEEGFRNAPGQWRGIYILEGSTNNKIKYTDIRNAEVGIRIGAPDQDNNYDMEIGHSIIENITNAGILSFTSDVYVYNNLINNCGYASIAILAGGNYKIINNTLANFSFDFFREDPTVILSNNVLLSNDSLLTAPLRAELLNNIIWGSLNDEIIFSNAEQEIFEIVVKNNLIRTTLDSLNEENIINISPLFMQPAEYDYSLESSSPAIDAGVPLPEIKTDLEGKERVGNPDLGAFEHIK